MHLVIAKSLRPAIDQSERAMCVGRCVAQATHPVLELLELLEVLGALLVRIQQRLRLTRTCVWLTGDAWISDPLCLEHPPLPLLLAPSLPRDRL